MNKKIAFVVPYPVGYAPSQRFRFEQYLEHLATNKIDAKVFSFLSVADFQLIYSSGKFLPKFWATIKGFTKRFFLLFRLGGYDLIYIHREASPIGPPWFEWAVARLLKKKVVYDFDDAIWIENTSASNKLISSVKSNSKVAKICRWSSLVFCGNDYLKDFAIKYNANAIVIPTTIDTTSHHNKTKIHTGSEITIGWTGTHTTAKYLRNIEAQLSELQQKHSFKLNVICNQDPNLEAVNYNFVKWNKANEINDLLKFDIGLMPMSDDDWSKGKCGFKALQYMALEIPAVVSAVGANKSIIQDNTNGLLVNQIEDWNVKLEALLNSVDLRKQLGKAGRETVISSYSVEALKGIYTENLINTIA